MRYARERQGFTLIELMISLLVLAILAALATPSFADFFERNRVRGAADDVVSLISNARGGATVKASNQPQAPKTPENRGLFGRLLTKR